MDNRVYNFSAGPSMLPVKVLEEVRDDLLDYKGTGESVMEMSHRSKEFMGIMEAAEADLRDLMDIPSDYKVMFIQGGATTQFSMVPLNLMKGSKKSDYVVTGSWAKKAAKEASKFGDVKIAASSEEDTFTYIPELTGSDFREDADYVHICFNNTIYGSHYPYIPETGNTPLVADMSSCILSEKIDVSKFGLIYAGMQKNIGPAGCAIAIMKEDLIGKADADTPVYLDYATHAGNDSMYNTPPCFTIYVAGLVFKYLKSIGGIDAIHEINERKAGKLYDFIDSSSLYKAPVREKDRSLMNVVFVTGDEEKDKKFVAEAKEHGMINLNGHRSIGGMRASIYNAMPEEGVDSLIEFMKEFERENG